MKRRGCKRMSRRDIPRAGEIYRHFKNKLYQIVAIATHTETGEQLVVYEALYDDFKIYARPLSMFLSEVDSQKYPEATQRYRFELIEREVDGTLKMGYPIKISDIIKEDKTEKFGESLKQELKKPVQSQAEEKAAQQKKPEQPKQIQAVEVQTLKEGTELEEQEEVNPLLLDFLNTDTYSEKLQVLISIRSRLDDRLIDDMATAIDVTVDEGPLPVRYEGLKTCLETMVKFECGRFR